MQGILRNSDLSDCDSNEPSDQVIPDNFNEAQLQSIDGTLFQVEPELRRNE